MKRSPTKVSLSPRRLARRYALQLRIGFRWLRFIEPLEVEFHAERAARVQRSAVPMALVSLAGLLSYLLFDLGRLATSAQLPWLALATLGAAAIGLQARRLPGRDKVDAMMLPAAALFGGGMVAAVLTAGSSPQDSLIEPLLLTLLALYLATGLSFRAALLLCTALSLAVLLGRAQIVGWGAPWPRELALLTLANAIGAVAAYGLEYGQRESFLLGRELRALAMLDHLTGLLNRRAFARHLGALLRQGRREQRCIGLAVLDVDGLGLILQRDGDRVAEQCVKLVASILEHYQRRPLDSTGHAARGHFMAVWYDVDPEWFTGAVNDIRLIVERRSRGIDDFPDLSLRLGALVGVPEQQSASVWLGAAERLLDRQRAQGKSGSLLLNRYR